MFDVNWTKFIKTLTPIFWRKSIHLDWLMVLISQVKSLHITFLQYRQDAIYKVTHTGQTISLTKVLNDKFDSTNRQIYIQDTSDISFVFLYNKIEGQSKRYVYNKSELKPKFYVKNKEEYYGLIDFIVNVPITIYTLLGTNGIDEMKGWVNYYKLAGKRYEIQSY